MSVAVCACGCGEATRISHRKEASRGWEKGVPRRFRPGHNTRLQRSATAGNWRGGKPRVDGGYVEVYAPEHLRANRGGRVQEHILVAEKALGKPLPLTAVVHHVDGSGVHNSNGNLVVCDSQGYHLLLHQRQRALDACGHTGWRKCQFCKIYDDPRNMYLTASGAARHRACFNTYRKDKRSA